MFGCYKLCKIRDYKLQRYQTPEKSVAEKMIYAKDRQLCAKLCTRIIITIPQSLDTTNMYNTGTRQPLNHTSEPQTSWDQVVMALVSNDV